MKKFLLAIITMVCLVFSSVQVNAATSNPNLKTYDFKEQPVLIYKNADGSAYLQEFLMINGYYSPVLKYTGKFTAMSKSYTYMNLINKDKSTNKNFCKNIQFMYYQGKDKLLVCGPGSKSVPV